jgi:signal transduction histidine kinase/CheY-like chemotaxis protein
VNNYTLYDTLFNAVTVLDTKGKILYSNHYFSILFKMSPRVIKKINTIFELFNGKGEFPNAIFERVINEPGSYVSEEIELQINELDTQCTVVIKFTSLEDKNILVCFNDISIETKLHSKYRTQLSELKNSHLQILQADKLATIGELSAGISHEISNPLTIAAGNIEIIEVLILEEKLKNEDLIKDSIRDVVESHNRITSIILNMKSFLRQQTEEEEEEREYCNLEEVILDSIKFTNPSFKKHNIKIVQNFSKKDIVALINRTKILQVLVNLLSNALDILVEYKIKDPKLEIEIVRNRDDNLLEIRVADNGPGIPTQDKSEIFKSFFTTKAIGEGTGLGLSIATQIIEAHQGVLLLEKTNIGASFLIQLPSIEIQSYTQSEIMQRARTVSKNDTIKIMVLDNEVKILNIFNKIFENEGIIFLGSANGYDALEVLENINVDLIITDYIMPHLSGLEFSKKVRELDINCPILYLSTESNKGILNRDRDELGIEGIILKPFSKEGVLKAIYQALKNKKEL